MSFEKNSKNIWQIVKPAYSKLDYSFDWTAIHGDEVSIVTSTWLVDAADATLPTINPVYTAINGFVTSAIIEGGVTGNSYTIRNRIVLGTDLEDERIFKLIIKDASE